MSNRFKIVMKAKLKKKRQAEREAKKAERPRVPWRWARDGTGTSFKANIGDVVSEKLTFKEYLNEVKYYRQKEKEDWSDDIDENGIGIGICPKCGGEARWETDWDTHGGMGAYWTCQDEVCGHEEDR